MAEVVVTHSKMIGRWREKGKKDLEDKEDRCNDHYALKVNGNGRCIHLFVWVLFNTRDVPVKQIATVGGVRQGLCCRNFECCCEEFRR